MKKLLFCLFAILYITTGCNYDNDFISKEENAVTGEIEECKKSEELVKAFSSLVTKETRSGNGSLNLSLNKKEKLVFNNIKTRSTNIIVDSINMYIYNIERNGKFGFAIATGDEITGQVYAYVENGSLSDTIYNESMAHMLRHIPAAIRENIEEYTPENSLNTRSTVSTRIYGPHVKTEWSQDYPYHIKMPGNNCQYYKTGCSTIALAQAIVHYQKFPINYNFQKWSQTSIILGANPEVMNVATFIKTVADEIGVRYGCDATSVSYLNTTSAALAKWGYISERLKSSDVKMDKLKRSMLSNNLSIFSGTKSNGKGHIWLVDGAVYVPSTDKITAVHCNFGWRRKANGWYAVSKTAYNKPTDYPSQNPNYPEDGNARFDNFYCNNDYIYFYELNR